MATELPEFDVDVVPDGDALILRLTGELDYGTVRTLETTLAEVARKHPVSNLRIDLRELDFIDSAGISALIAANAEAARRGARLQVVRGAENVQRALQVVGIDQIVEFVDG